MPNEFEISVDRSILVHLQSLAKEIIDRMDAIKNKYPEGTFDDGAEEQTDVPVEVVPYQPARRLSAKKKPAKREPKLPLSAAIRAHFAEHPTINVHDFSAANPHFNKQAIYPTLRSMAKAGHIDQDKEVASTYHRK